MKFLKFLGNMFYPNGMIKNRRMYIIISFLIMLLGTFVLVIPYTATLDDIKYTELETYANYRFDIISNIVTQDNIADEKYTTFEQLKEVPLVVSEQTLDTSKFADTSTFQEYILYSQIPVYDEEGTIELYLNYDVYIVVDFVNTLKEDLTYDVSERFDKLPKNENNEFSNILIVFYENGFIYRNEYQLNNNMESYIMNYGKVKLDFSTLETPKQLTNKLVDMLLPQLKNQYTYLSFIYVLLIPFVIISLAYLVMRNRGKMKTFKEYFNIGGMISLQLIIIFFFATLIPYFKAIGILNRYWIIFAIYYIMTIGLINKSPQIE